MSKLIVALAALASVGIASAQSTVTLSGKFGVAQQQAIGAVGGLAVTDGDVRFTAVEDLGGGLKATASMELRVRGRGNVDAGPAACSNVAFDAADYPDGKIPKGALVDCPAANDGVGGRNATVGLSGGFGSVTLGAVEAGNGIMGLGFAGAPVSLATGYDGAILSGVANVDWFAYTTPAVFPGLTATVQRIDSIGAPGGGRGTSANLVGANYVTGPVAAAVDFTKFSNDRTRVRASASYNLGVAKLGIGFEDNKKNGIYSDGSQLAMGVSVPMGAITLGAVYAVNKEGSSTLGDGKAQGWGIGADYALSKRTALNVSYGDRTKLAGVADNNGDQYRIRLMHSF